MKFRCNTFKIETETNYWNFECRRAIGCPDRCSDELFLVNIITYDVTIKTNGIQYSDTRDPIYIKFIGTLSDSPEKLLSDQGFPKDTLSQVSVDTANVGSVYGITLSIKGFDSWKPEEIIVKKQGQSKEPEERIFKIPNDFVLENPEKPMTIKLPRPEAINTIRKESEAEFIPKNAIKLSCDDKLKDNDNFGPKYLTNNVNYAVYYAKCPSNCMRNKERGVGIGIHPENSSICMNALIDRAISFYGGFIAISIFQGLPSYTGGKKM